MTIDEKAREKSLAYDTKYAEDSVLEDMLSRPQDFCEGAIAEIIDLLRKKSYRDGYADCAKELEQIRNERNFFQEKCEDIELNYYCDKLDCQFLSRNKWHYVKDGNLPKECENVLCYCKGPGIKFCCVGHTIKLDNKVRWWANNKTEELEVIAWKEIVLPELKE